MTVALVLAQLRGRPDRVQTAADVPVAEVHVDFMYVSRSSNRTRPSVRRATLMGTLTDGRSGSAPRRQQQLAQALGHEGQDNVVDGHVLRERPPDA
jgi:hypothetical protein